MMRTLYVTDLDGTLLRSDETLSAYTCQTINHLVEQGMVFSYATARSLHTASRVTQGLQAKIPVIIYNGTFIKDYLSQAILYQNDFGAEGQTILEDLLAHDIYPLVYAQIDQQEKFSYLPSQCTNGMKVFIQSRNGDERQRPVASCADLKDGQIFYFSCIDEPEKLWPLYEKYKDRYHCVYAKDYYTKAQWLEILPAGVSKATAISQLKHMLDCSYVIAFGDGKNDLEMFLQADECYAVNNAVPELKAIATGIIDSNDQDGVARWLVAHYRPE